MATKTITIPDNKVTEVLDALSAAWDYTLNKLPGETKAQFVDRYLMEFLERAFRRGKRTLYEESFSPPAEVGITVG